MGSAMTVAVTGAAGQIGYALLPRLISGEVYGPGTPIRLRLVEVPPALPALGGVAMELVDCAAPLLAEVEITDDPRRAFAGANWVLLIGSKPRTKGMERKDLIRDNGPIFVGQGLALERAAADVRVLVVGNPANTNCLIAMRHAARVGVPAARFAAMTRLDQNRARALLAKKAGVGVAAVTRVAVWGNHSATQYPDGENACIGGRPAPEVIGDGQWLRTEFVAAVQQRGAAVIAARGLSSAASAAQAVVDHVRSMGQATPADDWFSAGVPADGSYGVEPGLVFSYPLRADGSGGWEIVQGLPLSEFARGRLTATEKELVEERDVVADLLR